MYKKHVFIKVLNLLIFTFDFNHKLQYSVITDHHHLYHAKY